MMVEIHAIEIIYYKQQKKIQNNFQKKIPLLHEIEMHLLLLCPIVI